MARQRGDGGEQPKNDEQVSPHEESKAARHIIGRDQNIRRHTNSACHAQDSDESRNYHASQDAGLFFRKRQPLLPRTYRCRPRLYPNPVGVNKVRRATNLRGD